MVSRMKIIVVMAIVLLVVVFTLQNTEQVNINFLLWHVSLSRSLLLFLVFGLGMLSGLVLSMVKLGGQGGNEPGPMNQ